MKAQALLRVSLTVADLGAAARFMTGALGFTAGLAMPASLLVPLLTPGQAGSSITTMRLARGGQAVELLMFDPPGAPYPGGGQSDDARFQHCALVTDDIGGAYDRLRAWPFTPVSRNGPETLPGGIVAFKFRDTEGHPFELIQFPTPNPATAGGVDHTAIAVSDVERSIAFYTGLLGLTVAHRQVNTGPAQDALDGLDATVVDVVALAPEQPSPHLELLGYRTPRGRAGPASRSADIAATRTVFRVDSLAGHDAVTLGNGTRAALLHDPDGHAVVLLSPE